jgi:hypothetical protein
LSQRDIFFGSRLVFEPKRWPPAIGQYLPYRDSQAIRLERYTGIEPIETGTTA